MKLASGGRELPPLRVQLPFPPLFLLPLPPPLLLLSQYRPTIHQYVTRRDSDIMDASLSWYWLGGGIFGCRIPLACKQYHPLDQHHSQENLKHTIAWSTSPDIANPYFPYGRDGCRILVVTKLGHSPHQPLENFLAYLMALWSSRTRGRSSSKQLSAGHRKVPEQGNDIPSPFARLHSDNMSHLLKTILRTMLLCCRTAMVKHKVWFLKSIL